MAITENIQVGAKNYYICILYKSVTYAFMHMLLMICNITFYGEVMEESKGIEGLVGWKLTYRIPISRLVSFISNKKGWETWLYVWLRERRPQQGNKGMGDVVRWNLWDSAGVISGHYISYLRQKGIWKQLARFLEADALVCNIFLLYLFEKIILRFWNCLMQFLSISCYHI